MSLLSTFTLMFKTDAEDAADGVENLSDALENLIGTAENGAGAVDDVTESANTGVRSIGSLTEMIFKLGAAYLSFNAIGSGVMDNALAIDKIGKLSQLLGDDIVKMDAWGEAAARNGGSAEAFMGTIEGLNKSLADIKITGGGETINTLAMLGVSATTASGEVKSAFDILPELADSFQKMSTQKSFAFGKKLGLDQGTILLLQQGRVAVEDLVERQKMLGGVTKKGYQEAAKFNDAWDDTKRVFNSLWMSTNATILPALTSVLGALESVVLWVRKNQTLVEGFFIGIGLAITAIYLPAITTAAAATLLVAAPFIAIGVAIAAVGVAIAVLYEDFIAWKNGTKSLLGDVLGSFEDFEKKVMGVIDTITKKWAAMIGWFKKTGESISGAFDGFWGDDSDDTVIKQNTEIAMNTTHGYAANPLNSGSNTSNNNNQNVNIKVGGATIHTAGMTPSEAKKVFAGSMEDSLKFAIGQLKHGVDR